MSRGAVLGRGVEAGVAGCLGTIFGRSSTIRDPTAIPPGASTSLTPFFCLKKLANPQRNRCHFWAQNFGQPPTANRQLSYHRHGRSTPARSPSRHGGVGMLPGIQGGRRAVSGVRLAISEVALHGGGHEGGPHSHGHCSRIPFQKRLHAVAVAVGVLENGGAPEEGTGERSQATPPAQPRPSTIQSRLRQCAQWCGPPRPHLSMPGPLGLQGHHCAPTLWAFPLWTASHRHAFDPSLRPQPLPHLPGRRFSSRRS